jgi:hypothetical protein
MFKVENLGEFETEFDAISGCESEAHMKEIGGRKAQATVPLSSFLGSKEILLKFLELKEATEN